MSVAELDFTRIDITGIGWPMLGEVASNCDHQWDSTVADQLKQRPNAAYAQYSAWDFCGYVWHDGEKFNCQVWRYQSIREIISATDGADLMSAVSEKYGAS